MFTRCVALMVLLLAAADTARAVEKPNIVFILADDLGWRDLSGEGSRFYESPNIDSLAASGMRFTQGYATCQVCSPSRASILTGKYPTRHGITTWIGDRAGAAWRQTNRHDSHLPPDYVRSLAADEITLAEVFQKAGYKTFFAGKWHLGSKGSWPTDHGFEINKGGWDVGGPRGGFFAPWKNPNLPSGPDGESLTLRLGRETAQFIEQNKDKPFLAYLSFYTVHAPIQTTEKLWSKYRRKAESMDLTGNKKRFLFDRRLPVRQVQDCPIYAGMIEAMDQAVGTVLKKLKDLGLEEKTIVCFTSDNGGVSSGDAYATGNLPLRGGKGRQWEGGIREPFYIRAPGITKAGTTSAAPVSGIDFYPTLVELAGLKVPAEQQVDGVSLVPLFKGEPIEPRDLFWHYPHYANQGGEPSSIIRSGEWKLIFYHEDGRNELYHLQTDPGEQMDRATDEPQRTSTLRARLDRWLKATDEKFPTSDPKFDPAKRKKRWEHLAGPFMKKLEARHQRYLSENYKPNKNWWGSAAARD
ncbi:MAG: sulfatase [Phycisphaeraceae bacterium]|nr:sulfatase [Phycisphaeraceae bacterium]